MAANAVASAKQKIERLVFLDLESSSFPNIPNHLPVRDIEWFYQYLCSFEPHISLLRSDKCIAIDLEKQIEDVADEIEDLIGSSTFCFQKLLQVVQEITCLKDKLKKGKYKKEVDPPQVHFLSSDNAEDDVIFGRYDSILGSQPRPVGLRRQIRSLRNTVMRGSSKLKTTLVHGMAGCGKTTLVKQVYQELLVDFDIYFQVTITLNSTIHQILVCLLTAAGFHFNDGLNEMLEEVELGMSLMDLLKGKRYLCVIDNLWDPNDTWDKLKMFFPDAHNKSRIICISRNCASDSSSSITESYQLCLLGSDDSWKLLRNIVFTAKETLNPQLEETGKKIARKCEGLPLAIITMGKLLLESEKTMERWKGVLEDDNPFQIKKYDDQTISKSLFLSYDPLPYHLKLCFLHMGLLSQNYDIKCSQICRLWIAEGFISPNDDRSLEETAVGYFNALFYKNLVLYGEMGSESLTYGVHFVFRSLCIREAQDEKFCLVIKKYVKTFQQGTNSQRLFIHNNTVVGLKEMHNSMKSLSHVSSILHCGPQHLYPLRACLNFKYLKILHALSIRFYEFPLEVLDLFRLKYLAITYDGQLPRSLSKLWKLEFLIIGRYHIIKSSHSPSYFPMEIWNLQWLKHIKCTGLDLLVPNCNNDILEHLSELSGVSACSCTRQILLRLRNLKKLVVHLELLEDDVESFSFFHDISQYLCRLNSFKCVVLQVFNSHFVTPRIPVFPTTISKLSLSGCGFPWAYMRAISMLPNLQCLILKDYAFDGPVWEVSEGGFPQLNFLHMTNLNIVEWRAKSQQFPNLFGLEISHCYNLQEIPIEFAELPQFSYIRLYGNNLSVEKSVRHIMHKRNLLEDDRLNVGISKLDGAVLYFAEQGDESYISTTLEEKAK